MTLSNLMLLFSSVKFKVPIFFIDFRCYHQGIETNDNGHFFPDQLSYATRLLVTFILFIIYFVEVLNILILL